MHETTGALPPKSEWLSPAFADVYESTRDYALRYARTLTVPSQAEEAVSITFTHTWEGAVDGRINFFEAPDGKRLGAAKKYLRTAILHCVAGDARKAKTHEKNVLRVETCYTPAEQQTSLYADEMLVCAGAALKVKDVEILRLIAYGFSTEDAAIKLGMKEETLRSRLSRARGKLKDNPEFRQLAAEYGY